MDKVLQMWNNYCQAGRTQFSSAKQISVLIEQDCRWSKQIKLNKENCKAKVPFIEHVMMKNGIKADQRKSDATIKMERPTDVSAVQRLLVLVK